MNKIFIFVLITIVLVSFISFINQDQKSYDSKYSNVQIEASDRNCEADKDCILVFTKCSTCDCGQPVNIKFKEKYKTLYNSLCENYRGPVCEIYCPPQILICENNKCIASEKNLSAAPTNKESCEATNGEWLRAGLAQQFRCVHTYPDGGNPCNSSDECEGSCILRDNGTGYCKYNDNTFGCYHTIEQFRADEPVLCAD